MLYSCKKIDYELNMRYSAFCMEKVEFFSQTNYYGLAGFGTFRESSLRCWGEANAASDFHVCFQKFLRKWFTPL